MGKIDDYMKVHETALQIRGHRQQLLASNIANADTPNYKAKDINFETAMQSALSSATSERSVASIHKTHQKHFDVGSSINTAVNSNTLYRKENQGSVDGNTVDMDVERNAFVDNALKYEASLTMLNMQIKNLLAAIQG